MYTDFQFVLALLVAFAAGMGVFWTFGLLDGGDTDNVSR
jgi:hypothetical protein